MNFKRDTMWVAVTDTIYGAGFNADSMRYVPFGNGAQFEMAIRNDTTKSGAPLHLFQAQTLSEQALLHAEVLHLPHGMHPADLVKRLLNTVSGYGIVAHDLARTHVAVPVYLPEYAAT